MINEKEFLRQTEVYNNYLDTIIRDHHFKEFKGCDLIFVLSWLVKKDNKHNNLKYYRLDLNYIKQAINKYNYIEIHSQLQKVFNEFIPFVLTRKFLIRVNKLSAGKVCNYINKNNSKYDYNSAMDHVLLSRNN